MPTGHRAFFPNNKEFKQFVKKIEEMFTDEKLKEYWLNRLHSWTEEQLERIKEHGEK